MLPCTICVQQGPLTAVHCALINTLLCHVFFSGVRAKLHPPCVAFTVLAPAEPGTKPSLLSQQTSRALTGKQTGREATTRP